LAHTLMNPSRSPRSIALALKSDAATQARIELAACFRLAAKFGFSEGVCNHFSAVVPGHSNLMFINPFGYAFSEITASLLLVCDFDGNVVAGDGAPEATAFFIHARLHRLKPRVKVVLHTHMPNATALSMLEGPPLLWAGQTALKFYGRIAVDENYNGLALDASEGDRIAHAMGEADVVFLKNHGVMVTGPNVAEAWDDLYYLERAAEVQLKAMSAGRPLKIVSPAVARQTFEQMRTGDPASARAHMNSMVRILKAEGVPFEE
jgi:ribulose-5-phosphate 4-epimerase/fuculose-1-phosphate aldolase